MNRSPARVDQETRIKAAAFLPYAARRRSRWRAVGGRDSPSADPQTAQGTGTLSQSRDVWWWASRLLPWAGLVVAVAAPWVLLFADRLWPMR